MECIEQQISSSIPEGTVFLVEIGKNGQCLSFLTYIFVFILYRYSYLCQLLTFPSQRFHCAAPKNLPRSCYPPKLTKHLVNNHSYFYDGPHQTGRQLRTPSCTITNVICNNNNLSQILIEFFSMKISFNTLLN